MSDEIKVCVFKPEGRKYFQAQWVDPVTQKKKTRSTETNILRKAERFAGNLQKELNAGTYQGKSKVTWEQFRERYESEVLPGLAKGTRNKVSTVFNSIEELIAPKHLRSLSARQISQYTSTLRELGRTEATIKSHLAHLKSALRWAKRQGLIPEAPAIEMPKRTEAMKGRPLKPDEFELMIGAVPKVVLGSNAKQLPDEKKQHQIIDCWRFLLRGLWWSGLRLGEALALSWTDQRQICVDFSEKHPMFRIQAAGQKSNQFELLPMAPEFAEMLAEVPESERTGHVFKLVPLRDHQAPPRLDTVSDKIRQIGVQAGVKVSEREGKDKAVEKFASAHDLRRAFGFRWSQRVLPATLQLLMRHEHITTTMTYYVGRDAQAAAETIWQAVRKE